MTASWIRPSLLRTLLLVPCVVVLSSFLNDPQNELVSYLDSGGSIQTLAGTIAYSKQSGAQADIWTIDVDGTGGKQLTTSTAWDEHPTWSPDGTRLAYHSGYMNPQTYAIWTMNSDGSNKQRLTSPEMGCLWPSWSPDGTHIAFSGLPSTGGHYGIFIIESIGGTPRRLSGGSAADDVFPTWGLDNTVLFLRKPRGIDRIEGDIFTIDLDGSNLTQLTSLGTVNGYALSPDGQVLAVYDRTGNSILRIPVHIAGSATQLAAQLIRSPFRALSWSPDGKRLAFAFSDWGLELGSDIYIVNSDGTGIVTIPNTGNAFDPTWLGE